MSRAVAGWQGFRVVASPLHSNTAVASQLASHGLQKIVEGDMEGKGSFGVEECRKV